VVASTMGRSRRPCTGGTHHTVHACAPTCFFPSAESLSPLFLSLEKSRSIGRKRRMRREENVMVPFSLLPPRLHGWPRVRRPSSILGWRERELPADEREWRTDGRGRGGVGTRLYASMGAQEWMMWCAVRCRCGEGRRGTRTVGGCFIMPASFRRSVCSPPNCTLTMFARSGRGRLPCCPYLYRLGGQDGDWPAIL